MRIYWTTVVWVALRVNFTFAITFAVFLVFLHELHVQCMQIYEVHVQIEQRTKYIAGLHEAPPKRKFKEYYGIFRCGHGDGSNRELAFT